MKFEIDNVQSGAWIYELEEKYWEKLKQFNLKIIKDEYDKNKGIIEINTLEELKKLSNIVGHSLILGFDEPSITIWDGYLD